MAGKICCGLLAAASALAITPAYAQGADESETLQGSEGRLGAGEIVVTAQRRSESVLDVPLSIAAIRGDALQEAGIQDITSLRFSTPGFVTQSSSGFTQIFIRGIGNRLLVGADPSVATFIDDTPRVSGQLVGNLINVERVEVLKGAQGGLYGRNATGGVMNIITRQPTDELIAEGRISYGSKDYLEATAFVNLPLSDDIAANFTVVRKKHDDYTPNRADPNPYQTYAALSPAEAAAYGDTGQRAYLAANPQTAQFLDSGTAFSRMANQDTWSFDGKIAFTGDGFRIVLQADYTKNDDNGGNGWIKRAQPTAYGSYAGILGFSFLLPQAVLPIGYVYPNDRKRSKYDTFGSLQFYSTLVDYGGSVKADIDLPWATLTSITSMRWNDNRFRGDLGAANVPIVGFDTPVDRENFYQEFRLVSNTDGPFSWLAGASYFHENTTQNSTLIFLGIPADDTQISTIKTDGFSAYAQGEYELTDALSITGSLRYIRERKVGLFPPQIVPIFTGTGTIPTAVGEGNVNGGWVNKVVPAVTLSYDLAGGGNVYVRWARGVKTGGVNPVVHPAQLPNNVANVFKPEIVDTYEAGVKANLLNRKLQLSSAIFYNDYKDLQVTKSGYPGVQLVFFNAGTARTYGAEASVAWQPSPIFNISANLGYLNAKYKKFETAGIPVLGVLPFNSSGNVMPAAPKWQGGISATLDAPINDSLNVVASGLYSYISKTYNDDSNVELIAQKGFSLVNLRAGLKTSDERLGGYVSVRNLFNKFYIVSGNTSLGNYVIPGEPRIIMGTIEVKF